MNSTAFLTGVNYWPRRKAMYWWSDFDAAEVREEFGVIQRLGLSYVRIFLLWEDWQPDSPGRVSPEAMQALEQVCDIASGYGIKLDITFFTGHMSGPSWAPEWMLRRGEAMASGIRQVVTGGRAVDCDYLNPYTHPVAIRAGELLIREVVGRFHDHPAVGIWNLGNESDLFSRPPRAAQGAEWARRMTGLIHSLDDLHPVTWGLHSGSLLEDTGLRVHEIYAETDLAVMHGYPMYCPWARNPLDADFVPFLCALTRALCGKPVMMEEFGGCTAAPGDPSDFLRWSRYGRPAAIFMASEDELAQHIESVLKGLLDVGATGAMLWCYADYIPELYGRPPCEESVHERTFGLVRPDGTLKPHAEIFRKFATSQPLVREPVRTVCLDVSPDEYYRDPVRHAQRMYQEFLNT
jgi:endo-1,4-beta-mannosidase